MSTFGTTGFPVAGAISSLTISPAIVRLANGFKPSGIAVLWFFVGRMSGRLE